MKQSPATVSTILWHFTGGPKWDEKKQCQDRKPKPDVDVLKSLIGILTSKHLRLGGYREVISAIVPTYRSYNQITKNLLQRKIRGLRLKQALFAVLLTFL
jgi:hypothetical protein